MDAVVGLLDGVRARGAFVLRMILDPPWSMRIQDDAPLTLICQTHGRAAIVGDTAGTVWLDAGDVALTRGTEHYLFADDPATEPTIVIHPGNRCTTLSGDDLHFEMSLGVRTWGNNASGADRSIICASMPYRPYWFCVHRTGTRRWSIYWPWRPLATDRDRRRTSTDCSTCC